MSSFKGDNRAISVRVERSSRSERSRNVRGPSTPDRSPGQALALCAYAQGERNDEVLTGKEES